MFLTTGILETVFVRSRGDVNLPSGEFLNYTILSNHLLSLAVTLDGPFDVESSGDGLVIVDVVSHVEGVVAVVEGATDHSLDTIFLVREI